MTDQWREGARLNDPADECPKCGPGGIVFGSDFRKFGRQSVRVCGRCLHVYNNGQDMGTVEAVVPHVVPKSAT